MPTRIFWLSLWRADKPPLSSQHRGTSEHNRGFLNRYLGWAALVDQPNPASHPSSVRLHRRRRLYECDSRTMRLGQTHLLSYNAEMSRNPIVSAKRVCNADKWPRPADPIPDGPRWTSRHDPARTKNARITRLLVPPERTPEHRPRPLRVAWHTLYRFRPPDWRGSGQRVRSCQTTQASSRDPVSLPRRTSQGHRTGRVPISIPAGAPYWNGMRANHHVADRQRWFGGMGRGAQDRRLHPSPTRRRYSYMKATTCCFCVLCLIRSKPIFV